MVSNNENKDIMGESSFDDKYLMKHSSGINN